MSLTVNTGVVPHMGSKTITQYSYNITENKNTIDYSYPTVDISATPHNYYIGEDRPDIVEAELSKKMTQIDYYYDVTHPEERLVFDSSTDATTQYVRTSPSSSTPTPYRTYGTVYIAYTNGANCGDFAVIAGQEPPATGDMRLWTDVDVENVYCEHTGEFVSSVILDANGNQTDKCKITDYGSKFYVWWSYTDFEMHTGMTEHGQVTWYTVCGSGSFRCEYDSSQLTDWRKGVVMDAQLKTHTTVNVNMSMTES